jgi:hypothetical protein
LLLRPLGTERILRGAGRKNLQAAAQFFSGVFKRGVEATDAGSYGGRMAIGGEDSRVVEIVVDCAY